MKTMSQCVAEFETSSTFRRLAVATRKRQMIVLRRLIKQLPLNQPISRLTPHHIDAALYDTTQKVSDASLNAYMADLRRFATFIYRRGFIKTNVAEDLRNSAKAHTVGSKRRPLDAATASSVISVAERRHPRDGVTVMLMLGTGMRESEVCELRWQDVDLKNRYVQAYRPKIKDWHRAGLPEQLYEGLVAWKGLYEQRHGRLQEEWYVVPALAHRSERPGYWEMHRDWPMVPTRKQQDVGPRVKRFMELAGETNLKGRASHTLRRTAGNLLLEMDGIDVRSVQTFYGHKSLAMTELYLDKDAARDALNRAIGGFKIRLDNDAQKVD